MVAPEEGSWRCDEVAVSSSRSRHTDRFVCKCAGCSLLLLLLHGYMPWRPCHALMRFYATCSTMHCA
jgi:hypothetical protein